MPRTLFEKIWDDHLVARRADGRELIYIDRHVLHELHAPHAFEELEKQHRPVRRPDLTFSALDHTVATKPGRDDNTNPSGAAFLKAMREGSARNKIKVFDLHDPEQGISHVVAPELGMVLPGATHAVPDSHASTVGGVGALAFGCGTTELAHILATQVMAMKRPKRMLVRLDGKLSPHVTAKDVALRIIAEIGVSGARGSCRRICRLGDPRHADRAAHDAVQSQHRDGRTFRASSRPTIRRSNGSPGGPMRRRARCGIARWRIGGRLRDRRWRGVRPRGRARLRRPRAANHLGHRPEHGARHFRPRARSVRRRRPGPAKPRSKARSPTWGLPPAWRSPACR